MNKWIAEFELEDGDTMPEHMDLEYQGIRLDFHCKPEKIGHWIEEINDYGEVTGWHCDNCYEDSGFTTTCKWGFCPNCGAKMDEVKE